MRPASSNTSVEAFRRSRNSRETALTRQQIFHVTTHRSDTVQRLRIATDRDGHILAIGHDSYSGNLASEPAYAGAAVVNAIYNACGVRVRDYPVTLDKVLAGLPTQA